MHTKLAFSFCYVVLVLCVSSVPATAGIVYSNLGPPGNVYQCCTAWTVSGTGTLGISFTAANLFTAMASGVVAEIDLGVGYVTGLNSFYVAIFTDNGGLPETQLWREDNLSSDQSFGGCCGLIRVNVFGLTLTAGTQRLARSNL